MIEEPPDTQLPKTGPSEGDDYAFFVKGHLPPDWREWFDGLSITPLECGETMLTGKVADQSALHGILAKFRDLNLILIAMRQL